MGNGKVQNMLATVDKILDQFHNKRLGFGSK